MQADEMSNLKSVTLFNAFNNLNIGYCHWKSNEHLIPGLTGETDLDVLADASQQEQIRKVLAQNGFILYRSQFGARYKEVEDWIINDPAVGRLIHIHLHFRLATGYKGMKEYSLPFVKQMLDTSITGEYGTKVCDPSLELVMLYSRIALKMNIKKLIKAKRGRFKLSDSDKAEISYLKDRADYNKVKTVISQHFADPDLIFGIINKDALSSKDIIILRKEARRAFRKYRIYPSALIPVMKLFWIVVIRIRSEIKNRFNSVQTRRVLPDKKGIAIAFVGQDGSGKSTVTNDIKKWLQSKIEVRLYYLGSGEQYNSWQKRLSSVLSKKAGALKMLHGLLAVSNLKKVAKSSFKTLKKAKKYAQNGGIALFDRFPQTVVQGINDGPKIRYRYLAKASNPILRIIVKRAAVYEEKYLARAVKIEPDLVFKLMLSPEESIRRKPLEDLELVTVKHDIIKNMSFSSAAVCDIDATMPYDEEILEIKRIIWDKIDKCNAAKRVSE